MSPFKTFEKKRAYDQKRNQTEKRKKQHRECYHRNKHKYKESRKKYYLKNKTKILKNVKKYYKEHKAHLLLYRKGWKRRKKCKGVGLSEEAYSELTKECAICGFKDLVDLHHIDENRDNKSINNLIGLCPNHHLLIHRKKRNLNKEINFAIKNRKNGFIKS